MTAPITGRQTFEFIGDGIREAVYFNFEGEHSEHGYKFDPTVGLCDNPVMEGETAVSLFLAVVSVFDSDLGAGDALSLVARLICEIPDGR